MSSARKTPAKLHPRRHSSCHLPREANKTSIAIAFLYHIFVLRPLLINKGSRALLHRPLARLWCSRRYYLPIRQMQHAAVWIALSFRPFSNVTFRGSLLSHKPILIRSNLIPNLLRLISRHRQIDHDPPFQLTHIFNS